MLRFGDSRHPSKKRSRNRSLFQFLSFTHFCLQQPLLWEVHNFCFHLQFSTSLLYTFDNPISPPTMSPIKFFVFLLLALSMTGSAFTTPSRSPGNVNRNVALSFAPSDFTDVGSLVLAKCTINGVSPDVGAQVLSDGSHALMDFPTIFKTKPSKLHMRYAQVIGRLMILGTGLLPHHGFCPEELAVQVFLLGVSMKPIIRSIQLYRCIVSTECNEACELELCNLERSLP